MEFEYVDPKLPRKPDDWHSPILGQRMPIVTYGHAGRPLLTFPTAAADYLENERFFLIKSIEPAIKAGRLRVFSIDSINRQAWMDRKLPVAEQGRRQRDPQPARYLGLRRQPRLALVAEDAPLLRAETGLVKGDL